LLFPVIEGVHYQHEGEGSGPTMDEGMPDMEAYTNPFEKIKKLEQQLATSRALVEEYKVKVGKLKNDLWAEKNKVTALCDK
jgi:hypothetical protein